MAVLGDRVVALLDGLTNEVLDAVTDHRVDDVDDPLPRKAVKVSLVRQAFLDCLVILGQLQELLDGQTWVERSVEMLDVFGVDV